LLMLDLLQQGEAFASKQILLCGFGVGLGWGTMIMETADIYDAGISFYSPQ
jgi:3-oxoacyl-[acyl-carrier-protein] synthase III